MLNKSLSGFIQDERGSYTMWSVAWFMVYVGIGGLAVDATDVYRHETLLQATGDSSSMAGVMSLPNETEAVDQALAYAQDNMQLSSHGTVLTATDVKIGTWDFDKRQFRPDTAKPNAVYVTTRREESNENPLPMNMLRFFGLVGADPWWNVHAEAVAVRYIPGCIKDGAIAQDTLWYTNNNDFYNNFCLHAQMDTMGHPGAKNNTYEHGFTDDDEPYGVSISHGAPATLGYSDSTIASNTDLQMALDTGGVQELWPLEAYAVMQTDESTGETSGYIPTLQSLPEEFTTFQADAVTYEKYKSWSFLYNADGVLSYETELPSDLIFRSNTVYDIDCSGQINLNGYTFEADTALVVDCRLHANSGLDLSAGNNIIASSYSGPNAAINIAAQSTIGAPGYCDSETGDGGVEIYSAGKVKVAADSEMHGVRIAALGDIDLTSHVDAYGVSLQSAQNIDFQTHGDFGLCPNGSINGPVEWRYRLMQ